MARTVVQDFDSAFIFLVFAGVTDDNECLGDGFLRGCKPTQPVRIRASLYILHQLEVHKRKNESFGVEHDHKHVLSQLDVSNI